MRPLIALIALTLLPFSLARAADDGPRVRATLSVERTGDSTLRATYSATNVSPGPLRFVYSDGQQYEFVLSDEGREIWRWSAGMFFTQAMWEESLAPGASIVAREEFPWPEDREILLLQAWLTVAPWDSGEGDVRQEETRIALRLFDGADEGRSEAEVAAARRSDFDDSGAVDYQDFRAFEAAFGTGAGDSGFEAGFDLDGDGRISFGDFFLFASSLGIILPAQ